MAMKRFAADGGQSALVFHDLSRLFGHENIDLFVRKSRYQPPHERAGVLRHAPRGLSQALALGSTRFVIGPGALGPTCLGEVRAKRPPAAAWSRWLHGAASPASRGRL